jgi:hypothetical protein
MIIIEIGLIVKQFFFTRIFVHSCGAAGDLWYDRRVLRPVNPRLMMVRIMNRARAAL